MSAGNIRTGDGISLRASGRTSATGPASPGVAVTGSGHRRPTGEDRAGPAFLDGDHGLRRERGSHHATSLTARLVPVCLRLAVGVPELVSSLDKLQHLSSFVALWHKIHLPAAEILAPAYAAAELFGALLLLAGWQMRTVAGVFVAELLSEILLTKRLGRPAGWMLEWQSLWVVLILARIGAGPWSFDGRSARQRAQGSPANPSHQEA